MKTLGILMAATLLISSVFVIAGILSTNVNASNEDPTPACKFSDKAVGKQICNFEIEDLKSKKTNFIIENEVTAGGGGGISTVDQQARDLISNLTNTILQMNMTINQILEANPIVGVNISNGSVVIPTPIPEPEPAGNDINTNETG